MSVLEAHPHAAAVLGAALRDRPVARLPVPRPGRDGQARGGARVRRRAALARRARPRDARARALAAPTPTSRGSPRAAPTSCWRRHRPVGGGRRLAHAVRVGPARVRPRARRHDERPGGQSLLKTLEEPPRYVDLILLTDRPTRCCRRSPRAARRCASTRRRRGGSPSGWRRRGVDAGSRARLRAAGAGRRRARARRWRWARARRCAPAPRRSPAPRSTARSARRAVERLLARPRPPATCRGGARGGARDRARDCPRRSAGASRPSTPSAPARAPARRDRGARPRPAARRACGSATWRASPPAPRARARDRPAEPLRADAARDAHALRAALELVEDTRARLPFNVSEELALRGARLPARAHARRGPIPA